MSHRSRFNIGLGLIREAKHDETQNDDLARLQERVAALENAVNTILAGIEDGTLELTVQGLSRNRDK